MGDRHVHFLRDFTTVRDQHRHEFRFNTFIDNPIGEEPKKSKCDKRRNYSYGEG